MVEWFIRILMVIAGSITSWFVARDSLKFNIVQMVISIILITIALLIVAFWRPFWDWVKHIRGKSKSTD